MKEEYKQAANNYPLPKTLAKETSDKMKEALNMPVEEIPIRSLVSEDKPMTKKRSGSRIIQAAIGSVAVAAVVIFTLILRSNNSPILTELKAGVNQQEVKLKDGYLYFEETDETKISNPLNFSQYLVSEDLSLEDYKAYLGESLPLSEETILNLDMKQQRIRIYYDGNGNIKYDELYRVYSNDSESELSLYISKSPSPSYPWTTEVDYQSEINETPLWVEWNSQDDSYSAKFEYEGIYYFCSSSMTQEDFILFLVQILE